MSFHLTTAVLNDCYCEVKAYTELWQTSYGTEDKRSSVQQTCVVLDVIHNYNWTHKSSTSVVLQQAGWQTKSG